MKPDRLDIDTNNATPPNEGRRVRFRLRDAAQKALPTGRVAKCGCPVAAIATIKAGSKGARFAGVINCGSVWTCPKCAAQICETRRREIADLIEAHRHAGGEVYMLTLTVPHERTQTASELRSLVSGAWRSVTRRSKFAKWRAAVGMKGYVKALEVTHGDDTGWHPHLHLLLFVGFGAPEAEVHAFGGRIFGWWAASVEKAGYGTCNPGAFRIERANSSEQAGDYVAKWGADREMVMGHRKLAKGNRRSPWQLLADIDSGDRRAIMIFREYAAAFHGARQLTWSRGIRELYELREALDDEAAAKEGTEEDERVAQLPLKTYGLIKARGLIAPLLDAVEAKPILYTVIKFLKLHGINTDDVECPIGRTFELPPPDSGGNGANASLSGGKNSGRCSPAFSGAGDDVGTGDLFHFGGGKWH